MNMAAACDRCHRQRKSYPACHTQVTVDKGTGHPVKVTVSTFKEWQHNKRSYYVCNECLLELTLDAVVEMLKDSPDWTYPKKD